MTTFLVVFLLSYLYHGLGITVGYHRLLSHRAFKCPPWLEYFIVSGGYLGLEGSPVAWVATHRMHHRYSDRPGDPHRPADGIWHAFAGWLYQPKVVLSVEQIEQVCPDLWRDPVYRYFDFNHTRKHALVCLWLSIALRVAIFVWFGWVGVVANLLGTATVFVGPFLVNSVCHLREHGYRNFDTEDGSRNVWWVGLWALGEGWHNNHHAVPQSARHGIKPHEFDLSWCYISFLRLLGLATDIRMPKEPKSAPALDPEFAVLLRNMSATESISQPHMEELSEARSQLVAQLDAARQLSGQLVAACDELSQQVAAAKLQLSDNVGNAREQLAVQLLSSCDHLSEQLDQAKEQLGKQMLSAREQLSDALALRQEVETA